MKKSILVTSIICIVLLVLIGWYIVSRINNSDNGVIPVTDEEEAIEEEGINSNEGNNDNPEEMESKDNSLKLDRIYKLVEAIDPTIKLEPIMISPEEDLIYRKAYLEILRNNIPRIGKIGDGEYFRDLHRIGVEFGLESERFSYYYYDLDGDGLPELGVRSPGYTYILKYDIEENGFSVLYRAPTMYVTILGTGQIWYRDATKAGIIRDIYIVLNDNNEWEKVLEFNEGTNPDYGFLSFDIDEYRDFDIEEDYFHKTRERFLKAIENAIPSATFDEVFGDLIE